VDAADADAPETDAAIETEAVPEIETIAEAAIEDAAIADAAVEDAVVADAAVEEPATAELEAEPEPEPEVVAPVAEDPTVVPTPVAAPRVPAPVPSPRIVPAASAPSVSWGRVDEQGVVYVREADGERTVGEYPDATPEEALAYFERKFADLSGQVALVEQRAKAGANAADVAKTVAKLTAAVDGANAVGDLAALQARLSALGGTVTELTEQQREEQKAATQEAVAQRAAIVVGIEAIAARDLSKAQWKTVTAEVDAAFAAWQQHQTEGPRLPKAAGEELWKRFRAARTVIDTQRRAFYSSLDSQHKDARAAKQALVEKAEALAPKGGDGINAYRDLLEQWKAAGRAGKKVDDQLWDRFKAAGDVLYAEKSNRVAAENTEYQANLEAKLALLDGAADITSITDRSTVKDRVRKLQAAWEAIGRVPRERMRDLDEKMRTIEEHARSLDEAHLRRSLPKQPAPADSFSAKLAEAVEKAERDLAAATAGGNAKAIKDAQDALASRQAWLKAAKG
jgi:hypothetical protein